MDVEAQVALLTADAVDVISPAELAVKLGRGKPLRVKLGIDPTASDIHLGFAVVLRRLRLFQDCGHIAVLIIGDFTAMVGDPSGKSATRPRLSKEEVDAHAVSYVEQVGEILDLSPERLEVRRNSEWLGRLDVEDILRLTSQVTVARMLERDDFAKRYSTGAAISLMEFLYPLLQGLDSVEVRADVEIGGTDQLFNLIMARHLQTRAGQEPQVVLTTPLLVGLDGVNKMSKSLGNYVGIKEPANEQFGKLMSLPDELMPEYFTHATALGAGAITGMHPNAAKRLLARTVVDEYHGEGAGAAAEGEFDRVFKAHDAPSEIAEQLLDPGATFVEALVGAGLTPSKREARRALEAGSVRCDGEVVRTDGPVPPGEHELQVGRRRWVRIVAPATI